MVINTRQSVAILYMAETVVDGLKHVVKRLYTNPSDATRENDQSITPLL